VTGGRAGTRPLRTVLFTGGHDLGGIEAAVSSGADSVVIDLEEPRTPFPESERVAARALVRGFLAELLPDRTSPLIFVRVQPWTSGGTLDDLEAVMGPRLGGILVPKVQSPGDVVAADALVTNTERRHGVTAGSVLLYPILETAQALRLAYDIAIASPRVAYMGGAVSRFGDIHQALGYRWTPTGEETLFLRSKVLVDARAAGIRYPISGMWGGAVDDVDGLRAWAASLRDLGYYGMMIGDPAHVPLVHEMFTPTPDEIAYWLELDRLATEAERAGAGPIVHGDPNQGEGHVVHIAHIGSARTNLEWARALGCL
jgi:citrate lyase subunit beta / citryl-CoA lyase